MVDPRPNIDFSDAAEAHAPALDHTVVAILDSIPNAVLLLDEQARILLANAHAVHLFGFATVELLSKPIAMLVPAGFDLASARWKEPFAPASRSIAALELNGVH